MLVYWESVLTDFVYEIIVVVVGLILEIDAVANLLLRISTRNNDRWPLKIAKQRLDCKTIRYLLRMKSSKEVSSSV